MRRIKIFYLYPPDYYGDHNDLVRGATDWAEVSEEDFRTLQRNFSKVVEKRVDAKAFLLEDPGPEIIPKTIEAAIELAKQEAEKAEKARLDRLHKRQLKAQSKLAEKKAILAKLQAEIAAAEKPKET